MSVRIQTGQSLAQERHFSWKITWNHKQNQGKYIEKRFLVLVGGGEDGDGACQES